MTPTPTSGAADLRTAAQAVVDRWDTPLWKDVPATAEYIGRLRAALAAGQATAAQAGEYPALVCDYCGALTPDPWHSSGMLHGKMSKHIHSCDACASRGQAPADAKALAEADRRAGEAERLLATCKEYVMRFEQVRSRMKYQWGADQHVSFDEIWDEALALKKAARADRVQEDAACWQWLAEYLVGPRTDLDDEIVASETVNDLRNLVEAAIKQGATQ